ncbi:MAG: phosphate acyltransferase PlsX [Acidimicrobiia bacterium]|nr:phosphate acyltransferase PlsX [Acidimicrobiia bacterium]
MTSIALDALGGDKAPGETVAGALEAMGDGVDVVLVGPADVIDAEIGGRTPAPRIVEATEQIGMGDDPARAVRERPDSTIAVATRLVADGKVAGVVSAGSTGALLTTAVLTLKRIKGVLRPAIASIWPTPGTPTLILDSGANPEVKAEHLAQFGVMGSVASTAILEVEKPRVGLLSIGEEAGKGRTLEKEAYALLRDAPIEFIGNVEGRDVAEDVADVIVTDGFTGNVFLKTAEGIARMVSGYALEAMSLLDASQQAEILPLMNEMRERIDWETYGGGHLLGVNGAVVATHGSSSRKSIRSSLRMAATAVDGDLVSKIKTSLAAL